MVLFDTKAGCGWATTIWLNNMCYNYKLYTYTAVVLEAILGFMLHIIASKLYSVGLR